MKNNPLSIAPTNFPRALNRKKKKCVSLQQLKLEKQQRHEESEKKRQEEGLTPKAEPQPVPPPAEARPVPPQVLKKARRDELLTKSNETLAELYALTSRALKVDQEIEGNTWQFTREEFKTYVEAMGCTYEGGHGVHAKAAFPKEVLLCVMAISSRL